MSGTSSICCCLLVALASGIVACGGGPPEQPAPTAEPTLFSPSSFWNEPLDANAPLDPDSELLSGTFRAEVAQELASGQGPWINTDRYTTTFYEVGADQPLRRVELLRGTEPGRTNLQTAFEAVPLPDDARPSAGTDGQLTVWQPSTDKLWEFFRLRQTATGWQAEWGGAMDDVSSSPGYFTSQSWPDARAGWGATASSLPVVGGTIMLEELEEGEIDHALAIAIPEPRAGAYSWPAQRTDGFSPDPASIPEGARFRLDADLDLNELRMSPLTRMLASAAQRYGIVVRDKTGTGNAIGFKVEDTTLNGPEDDPFWTPDRKPRANGYLQGEWPSKLFRSFPWEHLELLEMELCSAEPWEACSWPR